MEPVDIAVHTGEAKLQDVSKERKPNLSQT